MKKLFAMGMAMVMTLGIAMPAFAAESTEEISERAHETEIKREELASKVVTEKVYPTGQPSEGYFAETSGFYVHFNEDGGDTLSVSVNIGGGLINVSVDTGIKVSGKGDYTFEIPNDGNQYKCYLKKKVQVQKFAVYERLAGTNNTWNFIEYQYDKMVTSVGGGVEKV